ncbi:sigma-54 dependent transcriptional regulator [candidate division NPL-UPA2 bacterium]|nr:sigma-54 dependent transcriptional regulator [candidate division NPL-UPA2 bacterium]
MGKILVVDDEENMRKSLKALLGTEGYEVRTASSGEEAIRVAGDEVFPLLITDLRLDGMDGMDAYRAIKERSPRTLAIIITGHASLKSAIEAIRLGAYDYLVKPFKPEEILLTVRRASEHQQLVEENVHLQGELGEKFGFNNIVAKSTPMEEVFQLMRKVAPSSVTVLLRGESGTGKELVARAIHYNSPRKEKRFIGVSCGALPETLLESELFGHEKGAFTGALKQKRGLFEVADGGTIFLDEIADLSLSTQMKLLRVLQEQEFQRVGGTDLIRVNLRLISATNKDLEDGVREGKFREELYYRINVVSISLPPLRERKDDIPLLVQHFLKKHQAATKTVPPKTMELLMMYHWPGNVRQLENVVERAIALSQGRVISENDLPPQIRLNSQPASPDQLGNLTFQEARENFEKQFLQRAILRNRGNISATSREIKLSRRHFYEKMKSYHINPRKLKSQK